MSSDLDALLHVGLLLVEALLQAQHVLLLLLRIPLILAVVPCKQVSRLLTMRLISASLIAYWGQRMRRVMFCKTWPSCPDNIMQTEGSADTRSLHGGIWCSIYPRKVYASDLPEWYARQLCLSKMIS